MEKIINPCQCQVWKNRQANAYVKITYDGKRLSFSGVIGPKSNGKCFGAAGQCVKEISRGTPKPPWNNAMLQKLCAIWDEWHLNDLRPYCRHQKDLGWDEMAREELTLCHYRLNQAARAEQSQAKEAALAALRNGASFTPTPRQTRLSRLPLFLDVYEPLSQEQKELYEPCHSITGTPFTESKNRGWVLFSKDKRGLLCRPCPVCGYKYGASWLYEEVPQDVLDWLFSLPETKSKPAWV